MRLQAILPALLFAVASSVPFSAYAAADPDKAPPADAKADQPAATVAKPQAQSDEKGDATRPMISTVQPAGKSVQLVAGQDRSKHYHPRDGK